MPLLVGSYSSSHKVGRVFADLNNGWAAMRLPTCTSHVPDQEAEAESAHHHESKTVTSHPDGWDTTY